MEWTIPYRQRRSSIIVSEPSPHINDYVRGLAADCPTYNIIGVPSNLESFSAGYYYPGPHKMYGPRKILLLHPAIIFYYVLQEKSTPCAGPYDMIRPALEKHERKV